MTVPLAERLRVVSADDCTVATLDALQGSWTEALYLKLTQDCNLLIEFADGRPQACPCPPSSTS